MTAQGLFCSWGLLSRAVLACLALSSCIALAREPEGKVTRLSLMRPPASATRIEALFWDNSRTGSAAAGAKSESEKIAEFEAKATNQGRDMVTLSGRYARQNWTLLVDRRALPLTGPSHDRFALRLRAPAPGTELSFRLTAVGPRGEVEEERFILVSQGPVMHRAGAELFLPDRPFSLSGSIGFSYITDTETQTESRRAYESVSMTGKFSAAYALVPPRWELALSGFLTLLPLTHRYASSEAAEADPELTARFIGLNFRVGYSLPEIQDSWVFGIQMGWYYLAMFAPNFGFSDLSGPQLFPTIRKNFSGKRGSSLLLYGKFSPVASKLTILSLNNREIATGLVYSFLIGRKHLLSCIFDASNLRFGIPEDSNYVSRVNTFTLGLGYSL